jgi:hypothetical protein
MGFPPPPHNGPPPPPEQGGGFGPPQGFGPPPPPADGYGPPPPADGYGYPQQGGYTYPQQGGGYGYPGGGHPGGFPPPQPPKNHTTRNVWIAVGAVAVVGAIVAAVAVSSGGDGEPSAKNTSKAPSLTAIPTVPKIPMPTFTLPTDFPSLDLPTGFPSSSDEPEPSATGGQEMPYVVIEPGKCFDTPSMTHGITTVQTVSCTSAHDAQSIANKTLTGTFATKDAIEKKAFSLCEADANRRAPSGGDYYSYVLFPQLITYQLQGRNTVTCALTLNDGANGKKLHSKLG